MAPVTQPRWAGTRNEITPEFARSILDYDPLTGIFHWKWRTDIRERYNARLAGAVAGTKRSDGYIEITIKNIRYKAHRLAWLMVKNEWPPDQIDHWNTIKSDNRFSNLRLATNLENQGNRGPSKNNKSGFKGVSRLPGRRPKWHAAIRHGGKRVSLGNHPSPEAASAAYLAASVKKWGEFAKVDGQSE